MTDRLDALLSAQMDDALTREEARELEILLASSPDHHARARAFAEVDARLSTLAEESTGDDNLIAIYDDLRTSLGFEESAEAMANSLAPPTDRSVPDAGDVSRFKIGLLGRPVVPLIFAAAAAFLFYLFLPTEPPGTEDSLLTTHVSDLETDGMDDLVLVLGYGDEMSEIHGVTSDDLDVIEQLDLLDFLSTRELESNETGERG